MADNVLCEGAVPGFFDFKGFSQNDPIIPQALDRRLPRGVSKLTDRSLKLYLLLRNWRYQILLSRTIEGAVKAGIVKDRPQKLLFGLIRHKYLKPYLSLNLSYAERFSTLLSYYIFISSVCGRTKAHPTNRIASLLWQDPQDQNLYLSIEQAIDCRMEGELTLSFFATEKRLYWLTISIFDGRCIGLAYERILFIGGVQGLGNSKDLLRAAAKSNGEISPLDMLMIGTRSLAIAFRAEKIVGVTKANHVSRDYAPDELLFDYDRFWAGLGGALTRVGYVLDIEPVQKPLSEVPATHRSRTRRKRERKLTIASTIDERVRNIFPNLSSEDAPSGKHNLSISVMLTTLMIDVFSRVELGMLVS